jgi:hypothetical protein
MFQYFIVRQYSSNSYFDLRWNSNIWYEYCVRTLRLTLYDCAERRLLFDTNKIQYGFKTRSFTPVKGQW